MQVDYAFEKNNIKPMIPVLLNHAGIWGTAKFVVDTGADRNIIPKSLAKKLKIPCNDSNKVEGGVIGIGGKSTAWKAKLLYIVLNQELFQKMVQGKGKISALKDLKHSYRELEVYITDGNLFLLGSYNFFEDWKLVNYDFPNGFTLESKF